jgi:competence protein ComEC
MIIALLMYLLVKEINVFAKITPLIDHILHFSCREKTIHFVESGYDKKTGDFIKLILFNVKDKNSSSTYFHMIDLSIVYLIVVSGFHISILRRIISYFFKKQHK